MKIRGITDECFSDYKYPTFYIVFPYCSFKCDKENGCKLCQNSQLINEPIIHINAGELIARYQRNPITKGIVLGGLEPFDSEDDLMEFLIYARSVSKITDPIIIYTGYTKEELEAGQWGSYVDLPLHRVIWDFIKEMGVIIKFGRFRPNEESHYDEILGVNLASNNQYAEEFKHENTIEWRQGISERYKAATSRK